MRWQRIAILLISLLYCVITALYAILIPPWEAPDEPAHYRYVSQLAERWRPPTDTHIRAIDWFFRDYAFTTSNYEWYQPALGYLPAALIDKIIGLSMPSSLPSTIPALNPNFADPTYSHRNLFMHEPADISGEWKGNWGLLGMRFFSSLWGLVVIYTTYRIGNLVDNQNCLLGVIAAGWVAFLPQFTFINASVRSDTPTNAIAALVLLMATFAQTSVHEDKSRYAIGIGILLGLGLISKYTFVYIVPVGVLAIILANSHEPRTWIKTTILVLLPALFLFSAYYLAFDEARAALVYTFNTEFRIDPQALTWDYLITIPEPLLVNLFFACFGWANILPPTIWHRVAFGISLTGTSWTLVQMLRSIKMKASRQPMKILTLLGVAMLFALIGVIRYNLSAFQPQGRLLFPAIAAWGVFCFWGLGQSLSKRIQITLGVSTLAFMLVFNLYALVAYLIPAYY